LEITLKEVHRGPCRTVVTLQLEADTQLADFLKFLTASNPDAARSLHTSMATITSVETYHNELKFKHVGGGVYEIKVPGIRLYCFTDEIEGLPAKLIIATNGGSKNTKREQNSDIQRATRLKDRYLAAKPSEATKLHYIRIDHEDPDHHSEA
jgi:putative component of toxin-antitoxin plasmid stabilization module